MPSILERYGTVLRCYDDGRSLDRYTIIPPRWAHEYRSNHDRRIFDAIGASESPFHPQGFGQHTSAMPGPHLGRRVAWSNLPPDVQRFARQSFSEYAPKGSASE